MTTSGGGLYDECSTITSSHQTRVASASSWRKKGSPCRPCRSISAPASNSRRNSARSIRNARFRALCCTDQQPGAVSPPQRHLWEANVLRPPEFEHAVQRGDGNGHLGHLPPFGP